MRRLYRRGNGIRFVGTAFRPTFRTNVVSTLVLWCVEAHHMYRHGHEFDRKFVARKPHRPCASMQTVPLLLKPIPFHPNVQCTVTFEVAKLASSLEWRSLMISANLLLIINPAIPTAPTVAVGHGRMAKIIAGFWVGETKLSKLERFFLQLLCICFALLSCVFLLFFCFFFVCPKGEVFRHLGTGIFVFCLLEVSFNTSASYNYGRLIKSLLALVSW